jgi:lysophospholipase L1-like esterase
VLGLGAAIALSVGLLSAVPATAAEVHYVALGDSYSSGVGTGDYDSSSGSCHRSPDAYPSLWDSANHPASFDFVACSGAKTADVLADQVSALSASTTLVSITIGGNDAGFSSVMTDCVEKGDSGCKTATDNAISYVRNTLPADLDKTYASIKSHAPSAKVVVLGYPHMYQLGGSCKAGISDTSRTYINNASDVLDNTISTHAGSAGFSFADVRNPFSGHEICSSDWWLNSLSWPVLESYHPNKAGQSKGFYPVLSGAA